MQLIVKACLKKLTKTFLRDKRRSCKKARISSQIAKNLIKRSTSHAVMISLNLMKIL